MDLLQKELDEIRHLWNIHQMVKAKTGNGVYGIPDELFYIPEVQGLYPTKSTWCIVPTKPLTIYYTKTTSTQGLKATPAMSIKKTLTFAGSTPHQNHQLFLRNSFILSTL